VKVQHYPNLKRFDALIRYLQVWDLTAGKLLHELVDSQNAASPVTAMGLHPSELLLATGDSDGVVRVWDLDRPDTCLASLGRSLSPQFATSPVKSLIFRPNPQSLVTLSRSHTHSPSLILTHPLYLDCIPL